MQQNQILNAMETGASIITPNNRLSEHLLGQYLKKSGYGATPKPACLPYTAFLRQTFKILNDQTPYTSHPTLLSAAQVQALWRDILTPLPHFNASQTLINTLNQAFIICENWQVILPHSAFQATKETAQFETLRTQFLEKLTTLSAITEHMLPAYLIKHLKISPIKTILWVCFDDYTPVQTALQAHFKTLGITQSHIEPDTIPSQSYQYIATDKQAEYANIAAFIKHQQSQNKKRIGIIVPNLNQEAPTLKRHLKQHFDDAALTFSVGTPLIDYPLVAHALVLLKLNCFEISHHEIQLLLSSPYLHHGDETHETRLSAKDTIALFQERTLPFQSVKNALKDKTPELFQLLDNITPYPKSATPAKWAALFLARLKALGFPGEQSLPSVQYQCFERFCTLFDELKTLSLIQANMPRKRALEAFQDLAKFCIFQPEKPDTPIQVLGLLEASGCPFDAILMCSATHQNLPSGTQFNAFLPIALQRELNMPYAHAKREHELAQKRITRFKKSTKTLVFSYPAELNDIPTLPSPLIKDLPHYTKTPNLSTPKTKLKNRAETYQLAFTEKDEKKGGSARLRNQALCPFRAFAEHRLHATQPQNLTDGPDASLRGQLIHEVLETLWQTLDSKKALLRLSTEALETIIHDAIKKVLIPLQKQKPHTFPKLVQIIEQKRLKQLVHAALDFDKARDTFTIEALEESFSIDLGALTFRIRLDRLDKLITGEKWLIDYKSRIPSPLPFDEEEPESPQILLYALLDNQIRGLLFLALNKGSLTCRGFAEDSQSITGIKALKSEENWTNYQRLWHLRLTRLADAFYEGNCTPTPKKTSTCQNCSFQSLCRI